MDEKIPNTHSELQLLEEEIQYIEILSKYIGDTPRTLKRFVNTYRIIRSHDNINNILDESFSNYKVVLLLLCESFFKEHSESSFVDILDAKLINDYDSLAVNKKHELECFIKRFSFDLRIE